MEHIIKAFASYRLPNETSFISIATSKDVSIANEIDFTSKNRFYTTSFDKKVIFNIEPEFTKENDFFYTDFEYNKPPKETRKSAHKRQVETIKRKINHGDFEKVVLSRVKHVEKSSDFNIYNLFNELCEAYPNAFVYLLYTELSGLWIGATPELLIDKQNNTFHTVSLAGTKLINEEWTSKEEEEQQFVTDFITQNIKDKCKKIDVSHREDKIIGSIKHLLNKITFEPYLEEDINPILQAIQPTPAVCGIPQLETMEYIKKIESHSRSFYAGAIGPVSLNNASTLFVNLRCMQVCKNTLALYVGGGITQDSNATDEWEETERKSTILINLINKQLA